MLNQHALSKSLFPLGELRKSEVRKIAKESNLVNFAKKIFDKWDKIWFEDVATTADHELEFQSKVKDPISAKLKSLGFVSNLEGIASPWVGMNILSVDQNTVIADERQTNLIKELKKHSINCQTVNNKQSEIESL